VDLAVDGPHALVAGTTGAGKSELLRTLVTSLAVVNRPDELVMVLVDYKGGSAFADCAALPHCVGLVTDLDPHLADRALTSLGAELKRRERLMAGVGARDLTAYRATDPETGLPRLVIVIDEFRALAEELPGFVDGLVRIAALGRSLGIHLVLATQRPAGIVSADVRANMNLRIALRLRDTSDSLDVLDSPAAATLPEGVPGRALLRTGAEAPRLVQVARVAGSAGEADPTRGPRVRPVPGPWVEEEVDELSTDSSTPGLLPSVVMAVTEAASALGAAAPASPWLPPLPTVLTAAEVPEAQLSEAQGPDAETPVPGRAQAFAVPWGLLDLPSEQRQAPACWDPVQESHLAVVGAPGAGATTLVRTVLGGLLQRHDPGRLHLYCFDSGSGLTVLGAAPHTGALVTPEEPARSARVLARLVATLQERRQALAAAGLTSYAEQSAGPDPWPLLVWVVDGWGRFAGAQAEQGRGAGLEAALRLLAEGPAVGIVAVVTGDRTLLSGRVSASLPCVWALRLADPTDLMLAGLRREQIPDTMPPGRAVRTRDGVTAQVAVLGDDPAGASQVAALAATVDSHIHRATAVPADRRPWRVVGLPTRCALRELTGSRPPGAACGHREPLLGLGGDEGGPTALALSPERGDAALVLGPPGSGRSTVLDTLAEELRRSGHRVVRVAPGRAAADLADELAGGPGPCVLVDDAEQLADTAVEEVVLRWAASLTSGSAAHAGAQAPEPREPGTGGPGALVVAAETERAVTAYRGLVPLAARSRTGVVLQPRASGDGGPLGVSVPTGGPAVPGRGVLVHRGTCEPVQVALPGPAP
jgi:DNA segregation ATPase FtsK/SpoIIIE, S-DNA-T family